MKFLKLINPEGVAEKDVSKYDKKESVMAVVFDKDNKIAILNVTNKGYYKLPGGGIEYGEKILEALDRECLEEIGCHIKIIKEVGKIVEYRKSKYTKQTTYCYLAKVKGGKGIPNFTESEEEKGFDVEWMDYDIALFKFKKTAKKLSKEKSYIISRDISFLEEAQKLILL